MWPVGFAKDTRCEEYTPCTRHTTIKSSHMYTHGTVDSSMKLLHLTKTGFAPRFTQTAMPTQASAKLTDVEAPPPCHTGQSLGLGTPSKHISASSCCHAPTACVMHHCEYVGLKV